MWSLAPWSWHWCWTRHWFFFFECLINCCPSVISAQRSRTASDYIFLPDRSGCWRGLQLLMCCAFGDAFQLTADVQSGHLNYYRLPVTSDQSSHFPSDLHHQLGVPSTHKVIFASRTILCRLQTLLWAKNPGEQQFSKSMPPLKLQSSHLIFFILGFDGKINCNSWPVPVLILWTVHHMVGW